MARAGCWLAAGRQGRERVSRRVGELVSERAGGQGSSWSTRRAERAGALPPVGYASGAGVTGYPLPG